MISAEQVELIRNSAERLAELNVESTNAFYTNLFQQAPAVRHLFPEDMFRQSEKLWNSVVLIVESADDLRGIQNELKELGSRHTHYGALPEHYEVVARVLVETISSLLGEDWNESHRMAWEATLAAVCETMLDGAAADAA